MKNKHGQNFLKRVDLIFDGAFLCVLGKIGIIVVRARTWLAARKQLQVGMQAACVDAPKNGTWEGSFFHPQWHAFETI